MDIVRIEKKMKTAVDKGVLGEGGGWKTQGIGVCV